MAVLTVNTRDPNKFFVRRWMEQRGYDFPVLWGDGYYRQVGVMAFPTTLVVDREGKIAFKAIGGTEHFAQEFGWRIDAVSGG